MDYENLAFFVAAAVIFAITVFCAAQLYFWRDCKVDTFCRGRAMNGGIVHITVTLFIIFWIAGVVLAKGFWSTLSSIIFPPYAWYLIIEKVMGFYGIYWRLFG